MLCMTTHSSVARAENLQVEGADIFTTFLQDQYRALSNIKFPTVTIKKPNFLQKETETNRTTEQKLSASPYVNLKKEIKKIPYPSVSPEKVKAYARQVEQWHDVYDDWEKSAQSVIANFERQYEEHQKENPEEYFFVRAESDLQNARAELQRMKATARAVRKNKKALESYSKVQDSLNTLSEKIETALEDAAENTEKIQEYNEKYFKVIQKNIKKLEKYKESADSFMESLEKIIEPFKEFSKKYPTQTLDRGTLQEWILRTLLKGVDFPVYTPPVGEDITLDLTDMAFGMDIHVPDISAEPVEMDVFEIPKEPEPLTLPSFDSYKKQQYRVSWWSSLLAQVFETPHSLTPAVPQKLSQKTFPEIPKTPDLPDFDFSLPAVKMETLPQVDIPELPPNPLKKIKPLIQVVKPFLNLMGILSMGNAPVPEWNLKSYVQQQTNRTEASDVDFASSAVSLVQPRKEKPKQKTTTVKNDFEPALSETMDATNQTQKSFECTVERTRSATKGTTLQDDCRSSGQDVSGVWQNFSHDRWRQWAAALDGGGRPMEVPESFQPDDTEMPEKTPQPFETYIFSAESQNSERFTHVPFRGDMVVNQADLDSDGVREVLYSVENELYYKNRVDPPEDRALSTDQEAEEKLQKKPFEVWSLFDFERPYAFARDWKTSSSQQKGFLELRSLDPSLSYYEWVISDRPDMHLEEALSPDLKKSTLWDRIGFLRKQFEKHYDIRPKQAQVVSVQGNPLGYVTSEKPIQKVSLSACDDPVAVKPFFPEKSVLLGVAPSSRMEIRTPARAGQQKEIREIVIRDDEETTVEYAEVCLTRGAVNVVETHKKEKVFVSPGQYIFDGDRIELGKNDAVVLEFFDGTRRVLRGEERYTLHIFDEDVDFFRRSYAALPGNYYAYLTALKQNKTTYWVPGFLLQSLPTKD